jgi:quercetin dioxygenase-like cupin family protein
MQDDQPTEAVVVQPDQGEIYWQPVPANGFIELKISQRNGLTHNHFDCGVQSVAPGCFVREHAHNAHEELIFVYQGNGKAIVDGIEHVMQPGTTLYLDPLRPHEFINTGDRELRFFWVLLPGGLSEFFAAIGRRRQNGDTAPEPFPRPQNIAEIEAATVFANLPSTR